MNNIYQENTNNFITFLNAISKKNIFSVSNRYVNIKKYEIIETEEGWFIFRFDFKTNKITFTYSGIPPEIEDLIPYDLYNIDYINKEYETWLLIKKRKEKLKSLK